MYCFNSYVQRTHAHTHIIIICNRFCAPKRSYSLDFGHDRVYHESCCEIYECSRSLRHHVLINSNVNISTKDRKTLAMSTFSNDLDVVKNFAAIGALIFEVEAPLFLVSHLRRLINQQRLHSSPSLHQLELNKKLSLVAKNSNM